MQRQTLTFEQWINGFNKELSKIAVIFEGQPEDKKTFLRDMESYCRHMLNANKASLTQSRFSVLNPFVDYHLLQAKAITNKYFKDNDFIFIIRSIKNTLFNRMILLAYCEKIAEKRKLILGGFFKEPDYEQRAKSIRTALTTLEALEALDALDALESLEHEPEEKTAPINTLLNKSQILLALKNNELEKLGNSDEQCAQALQKYIDNETLSLRAIISETGINGRIKPILAALIKLKEADVKSKQQEVKGGVDAALFSDRPVEDKASQEKKKILFLEIICGWINQKIDLYALLGLDKSKSPSRAEIVKKCHIKSITSIDAKIEARAQNGITIQIKFADIREMFQTEGIKEVYDQFFAIHRKVNVQEIADAFDMLVFNKMIHAYIEREIDVEIKKLIENNVDLYKELDIPIDIEKEKAMAHLNTLLLDSNVNPNKKEFIKEFAIYVFQSEHLRDCYDTQYKQWKSQQESSFRFN
jgi:hypothetical protein